jgi:hypothetical protein
MGRAARKWQLQVTGASGRSSSFRVAHAGLVGKESLRRPIFRHAPEWPWLAGSSALGERPVTVAHYLGLTPKWVDGTAVGGCSFMIHVRSSFRSPSTRRAAGGGDLDADRGG